MLGFPNTASYAGWHDKLVYETASLRKTAPDFAALPLEEEQGLLANMVDNGKLKAFDSHYLGSSTSNRIAENDRGGDGHGGPSHGGGSTGGSGGNTDGSGGQSPYCRMQYDACVGTADANLYSTTIGCAIVVVTVPVGGAPLGVTCEAAAIWAHRNTVIGCGAAFQMCR